MHEVVIVGAARTAIGGFQGALAPLPAPALGRAAIASAITRAGIAPSDINQVLMGCVLPAGVGQAPARQAARGAGLPDAVPCTTINKVCGSGLKAVMLGAQAIALGEAEAVVAGGMESMSNVPYYLPQARAGLRMGHARALDGMILDGLWDPYHDFHMGTAAERCARAMSITRAEQDAYAAESLRRARAAQADGLFREEIVPLEVPGRKGAMTLVDADECPTRGDPKRLPELAPAFSPEGTVTAGNASAIADGAAALVLMSAAGARRRGLTPLARLVSSAEVAQEPAEFTTAPAVAISRALERAQLKPDDIGAYEINEAFAVVAIANARLLGLGHDRMNINGGAVALGHPIGASGARVLVTLLRILAAKGLKRGCASLCIGGGEAVAVVVER